MVQFGIGFGKDIQIVLRGTESKECSIRQGGIGLDFLEYHLIHADSIRFVWVIEMVDQRGFIWIELNLKTLDLLAYGYGFTG